MHRLDHRELRNSKVELMWVVVGGGWWVVVCRQTLRQVVAQLELELSTTMSIEVMGIEELCSKLNIQF